MATFACLGHLKDVTFSWLNSEVVLYLLYCGQYKTNNILMIPERNSHVI